MSFERNCPFCDIDQDRVIRSGELCTSLLSNPRLRGGHSLVVPTRHIETPMALQTDEMTAIYTEIQRLQQRLLDAGLGQGCDTWQKYQPFVPQGRVKMDHVHFHLLPRNPEDRLFMTPEENQWDVFETLTDEESADIMGMLR